MTNLESAVVGLLEQLARISDEHDEVLDTDVREAMRLTVSWYFVWGQPRTRFPRSFGTSSADGDRQVADALNAFLDAAERSRDGVRIPQGQPRLDILQSDAAQTAAGATYDEFVGHADTLTPAAPLPEHMFEEAAYDDDDDDDDRELAENPLVQRWRAKQIDAEPLDSPRWTTWTHSYGSADDVPEHTHTDGGQARRRKASAAASPMGLGEDLPTIAA